MTPERWQHLKDLFYAALEREPGQRAAFLDRACAGDPSLRAEVETLIASSEQAGSFIEGAIQDVAEMITEDPSGSMIGRRIGPYRVMRELGHGGMGMVYLAVRADDQYQEQVAIKLVRGSLESRFILTRFRRERQILANLNHPNIARLLDGGTTEDGLPYLVMEYIEGTPIDDYSDSFRLSITERLKLFRTVCSAAHYAHQNLVVHRDIKPSNILITSDGVVKLVDFGIAKLLSPEAVSEGKVTATGLRLMTPEYASPEQVRGEPITTASDIYSLGVLLYELLTGHQPYRFKSRLPQDIARVICDQEPTKPSAAIRPREEGVDPNETSRTTLSAEMISRRRGADPKMLRRRLAGDLDNIVLMALHKEPQQRYASVQQFSEDIRRHLEGLPVMARKPTLAYRTGKFIRRHRLGVMAAALIIITWLVGMIATLWQARIAEAERARAEVERARAERRFNQVRQLAHSYLFELHDAIQDLPGSTPARELLVRRALQYLDSLAQEARDDPSLRRELATAYQKVGDVQGRPGFANLGDKAGALNSYRQALAIRQTLSAADPSNPEIRRELATTHVRIGDTLRLTGDTAGAVRSYRRARMIREALLAADPTNVEIRRELAMTYQRTGDMLALTGHMTEALEHQRQSLELLEALSRQDPDDAALRRILFIGYVKIGDRRTAAGETAAALESYRRGLAIARDLSDSDATNARARRELAAAYDKVGNALAAMGQPTEALQPYRQAFDIRQALAEADPANAEIRRDLSVSFDKIGSMLAERGDTAAALESYRNALANDQALAAADPENAQARHDLSISYLKVADMLARLGQHSRALAPYRRAQKIRETLSAADPTNVVIRRDVAESYFKLGSLYAALASEARITVSQQIERWHQARSWYRKSLDILLELRARGALSSADADEPDNITRQITRCDAALAKLQRQ